MEERQSWRAPPWRGDCFCLAPGNREDRRHGWPSAWMRRGAPPRKGCCAVQHDGLLVAQRRGALRRGARRRPAAGGAHRDPWHGDARCRRRRRLCPGAGAARFARADLPLLWIGTSEVFREAGLPYAAGASRAFRHRCPKACSPRRRRSSPTHCGSPRRRRGFRHLSAVLVEMRGSPQRLDLTATRRLHRRALIAGRPVFLIREAADAEPTAAPVRLVVSPAPAAERQTLAGPLAGSIGPPAFSVSISKSRTALSAAFILEWNSHDSLFRKDSRRIISPLVPVPAVGPDLPPAPGSVVAFPRLRRDRRWCSASATTTRSG